MERCQRWDMVKYVFPFLAHAVGTLVGSFAAAKLAANNKMKFALGIGVLFLLGGIYNIYSIGGSVTFMIIDLVLAYLPMAYLGGKIATRVK